MSDVNMNESPSVNAERDAIHVAIIPAVASESLLPGQRVGKVGEEFGPCVDVVGIVNPFLGDVVQKGQRFWLCLMPNTVTGMRHHWRHPLFSEDASSPTKEESEMWLRAFAMDNDCPEYDILISAAMEKQLVLRPGEEEWISYQIDDEYLHFDGLDAHGDIPDEFWEHLENLTGQHFDCKPGMFSCSC